MFWSQEPTSAVRNSHALCSVLHCWVLQALFWNPQALFWSPQARLWSTQALFWSPQAQILFWNHKRCRAVESTRTDFEPKGIVLKPTIDELEPTTLLPMNKDSASAKILPTMFCSRSYIAEVFPFGLEPKTRQVCTYVNVQLFIHLPAPPSCCDLVSQLNTASKPQKPASQPASVEGVWGSGLSL